MPTNPLGRPIVANPGRRAYTVGVPITHAHRLALLQEAQAAGYHSLAAFIRERKLGEPGPAPQPAPR